MHNCGYQGSLGAYITFAMAYGMDLDAMADKAWDTIPAQRRDRAKNTLEWYREKKIPTYGLRDRTAIVVFAFVQGWRDAHPMTTAMWKGLEDFAKAAINRPDHTFEFGRFKFRRSGAWLRIQLPSGRCLCYPHPRVSDEDKISYAGINQYNRQWSRIWTYGGKVSAGTCCTTATHASRTPAIR